MGKRIPNVQRKKAWEVVKASKDNFTGIGIDGKYDKKSFRKFSKEGAFVVHDAGEAHAIEEQFGSHSETGDGSVVVCEVDNAGSRMPRRVFQVPDLSHLKRKEEKDGNNEP